MSWKLVYTPDKDPPTTRSVALPTGAELGDLIVYPDGSVVWVVGPTGRAWRQVSAGYAPAYRPNLPKACGCVGGPIEHQLHCYDRAVVR